MSDFSLSTRSISHMFGMDSRLITVAYRAIEITKIDFGIPATGGLRTADQQNALFQDGKSKADGFEKLGKHQSGKALDFYAYVDGEASWKEKHLAQIAAAFLQAALEAGVRIRWGGLFRSFTDMPHVEIVGD